MNDYSDIIYLIGAMVMFSILTLNVSRTIVMNSKELSKSEIEYSGIALAQGYADRAQWAEPGELDPDSSAYVFDATGKEPAGCDYSHNNPCKETLHLGASGQYSVDYYIGIDIDNNYSVPNSDTNNKKITINVTSPYFYENFDSTFTDYPIKMNVITSFQ